MMSRSDWKKRIQKAWQEIPTGWETHVQHAYAARYLFRQKKADKNDRRRHWQQYLDP